MRENRGGRRVLGFQEALVPLQLPACRRQSGLQGGRSAQRNNASDIFKSCFSGLLEALLGRWRQHSSPAAATFQAASLPSTQPVPGWQGSLCAAWASFVWDRDPVTKG